MFDRHYLKLLKPHDRSVICCKKVMNFVLLILSTTASLNLGAVIKKTEPELTRSSRDLIAWNRQNNMSYKLRKMHSFENLKRITVKTETDYLNQIKAFLDQRKGPRSRKTRTTTPKPRHRHHHDRKSRDHHHKPRE